MPTPPAHFSFLGALCAGVFYAVTAQAQLALPEARDLARSVGCLPGEVSVQKQAQGTAAEIIYAITCTNSGDGQARQVLVRCKLSLCQVLK